MRKFYMVLPLMSWIFSGATFAATIPNGQAAELALHRVDRLVLLKKAEPGFLLRLQGLTIEAIPHQSEADVAFKIVAYQFAGADNTRRSIELSLNQEGKTLQADVKEGAEPVGFPNFPGKNALTLFESAIHHLLHAAGTDAKLKLYAERMNQFSISSGKNTQNQDVAVVDIVVSDAEPILKIFVKFDGTVDSVVFAAR